MSQRQLLENSILIANTLRGPAKILTAPFTLAAPVRLEQIIDPTGGAAATGWTALGLTRGGINVTKHIDTNVLADVDQIVGAYDEVVTGRQYNITTQLAEIFDGAQRAVALETGVATQVSTAGATQVMTPLDSGSNVPVARRMAVVFPKGTEGRAMAFFFRNVKIAGGDKVLRFDKSDPASPALEFVAFPEIATTIETQQAWGAIFDNIGG